VGMWLSEGHRSVEDVCTSGVESLSHEEEFFKEEEEEGRGSE